VADRPGVLAEITAAMRDAGVSIESLIQKGQASKDGAVIVAIVTHEGPKPPSPRRWPCSKVRPVWWASRW
jgi:predicted regulator of amino acid metabolism with ACT domain